MNKIVLKNIFNLFILQGLNYALPLVTIPFLTRTLTMDGYGIYTLGMSVSQYLIILTDYGFNYSATRKIALCVNHEEIEKIFSRVFIIKFLILLPTVLLLFLATSVFGFFYGVNNAFVFFALITLSNALFPVWFFQGMEKMQYITYLSVIFKVFSVWLLFYYIKSNADVSTALLIQASTQFVITVAGLCIIFLHFNIKLRFRINLGEIIEEMRDGYHVFISTIAGSVFGSGGVIVCGLALNPLAAAHFSLGQKIESSIVSVIQPVAQGIYPYLCKLKQQDIEKYKKVRLTILLSTLVAVSTISSLVFVLCPQIMSLLVGSDADDSIFSVRIFLVITVLTAINVILNPFILSLKNENKMKYIYMYASVFFILFSFPVGYYFGVRFLCVLMAVIAFFMSIFSIKYSVRCVE